jgi:hypothetical protein
MSPKCPSSCKRLNNALKSATFIVFLLLLSAATAPFHVTPSTVVRNAGSANMERNVSQRLMIGSDSCGRDSKISRYACPGPSLGIEYCWSKSRPVPLYRAATSRCVWLIAAGTQKESTVDCSSCSYSLMAPQLFLFLCHAPWKSHCLWTSEPSAVHGLSSAAMAAPRFWSADLWERRTKPSGFRT